jgi:hypothetical protein
MLKEEEEMTKMTKRLCTVLVVVTLGIGFSDISHAIDSYLPLFNTQYGTAGSVLNTCTVCHTAVPARNAYGTAYGNNAHDFTAIEPLDSDADGFTNLAEITARTFPGNAASKPIDKVKPTVTGFTIPATSNSLTVSITALTATDTVGVTGYMVTTSALAPGALSTKWSATAPASFTFPPTTKSGTKNLYAWAKDAAKNVSLTLSVPVVLSLPGPDRTKPTVTGFAIPATSSSLTVTITTFTASDNVGVTAYMVTTSALAPGALSVKWTISAPTSFTFPPTTKSGTKTLYAWAKDAAKNVSLKTSAPVAITLTAAAPVAQGATQNSTLSATTQNAAASTPNTLSAQTNMMAPVASADITAWTGKWFKVTIKNQATMGSSGVSGEPQTVLAYLAIGDWDSANMVFDSQLYQYDAQTNEWLAGPMPLHYISGSEMEFLCWSQVTGDSNFGFTAQLRGTMAGGVLERATFKSVGGYHVQGSSQPGSTQQQSGWLTITGKMVSDLEVPTEILLN